MTKRHSNELVSLITEGLEDAVAYFEGDKRRAKKSTVQFIELAEFNAERIKRVRKMVHLTQERLGALLGVQLDTVKKWETGVNVPRASNARLLQMLEANPEAMLNTFEKHD